MLPFPTGYGSPANAYRWHRLGAIFKHREPKSTPANGGQNNRAAMADGLETAPSAYPAAFSIPAPVEDVIGHEALYEAARKCFRGVGWKWSVQHYKLTIISQTLRLEEELASGRYKEGKTHPVHLTYPKKREALAISLRDRVVQRSVNDRRLYPAMTRDLIYANFACQKGKGTDAARNYWFRAFHSAFHHYGTSDLALVVIDMKGYYDSMRHDVTNAMIAAHTDAWTAPFTARTLDKQYKGAVGYNPGSQMVQIAGISYMNTIDHFVKERLRIRHYVHYMDDLQAIMPFSQAEAYLEAVKREAAKLGLTLHPEKTRITSVGDGAVFLGFLYRLTESGKVLMFRDPKRVKEIRRRMKRLASRERRGEVPQGALDESYRCVRACMEKGNSRRLLLSIDNLHDSLKGEIHYGRTA